MYVVFLFLFLSLYPKTVDARVVLNEVFPVAESGSYEWVEIYNDGDSFINLSTYEIFDLTGKTLLLDQNILGPFTFALATSSGVLNNGGDSLFLKNSAGDILETLTYPNSLSSTETYAKCPDGSGEWTRVSTPTKSSSNTSSCLSEPTTTSTPSQIPTTGIEHQNYTINNIFISEIMINPVSGENEWIELYNQNGFVVELKNWFIDDIENSGSPPIAFSLSLPAESYAVIELNTSMLNNSGDQVRLLDFGSVLKDFFSYETSSPGLTYGRVLFDDNFFCKQNPSKGLNNNPCTEVKHPPPAVTPSIQALQTINATTNSAKLRKNIVSFQTLHAIKTSKKELSQQRIPSVESNELHQNKNSLLAVTSSSFFLSVVHVVYSVYRLGRKLEWKVSSRT